MRTPYLITALLALCSACTAAQLPAKYACSGVNQSFSPTNVTFTTYIKDERSIIQHARLDLTANNRTTVISGNAPFILEPAKTCPAGTNKRYKRGILLIHGLSGSPYVMRAMGNFFAKNCFYTTAILLPGHGTRPGDLSNIKWEDWYKAVQYGVDTLAGKTDEIYLAGYSVGGTLAIKASIEDKRIRGLFLFSPAIKISAWAMITGILDKLSPLYTRLGWLSMAEDRDPFRYESVAMGAVHQVYLLTQQLNEEIANHKVTIPVMLVLSKDDATVDANSAIRFFAKDVINKDKHMVLYTTHPKSNIDGIPQTQVDLVQSAFPQAKILGSSHTAILTPPDDPHYGVNGNYVSCIHYNSASKEYHKCQTQCDFSGEITHENYRKGIIRRLMYNPNFYAMQKTIKHFIYSVLIKDGVPPTAK